MMARDPLSVIGAMRLGGLALLFLVGGFGLWAGFAQLSGAVVAAGRVETALNRQVVQHPEGGVVAEVLVAEGDQVSAGAPLIRLRGDRLQAQIEVLETRLFAIVARRNHWESERDAADAIRFDPALVNAAARRDQVQAVMEGQTRLFEARRATFAQDLAQRQMRHDQIGVQLEGLVAQRGALHREAELVARELQTQQSLQAKGLASAQRLLGLQRDQARLLGRSGEVDAAIAQLKGRRAELLAGVLGLKSERQQEVIARLRDLHIEEVEVREAVASLKDQKARLTIRAPVAGVVHGLNVFAKQSVIRAADPVMWIVPEGRAAVIVARIDAQHIDQIASGQEAMLRFSTLDMSAVPELRGRIQTLSADTFPSVADDGRGADMVGYYRAEIIIPDAQRALLPEDVRLIPGMPVDCFFITKTQTPLAYLIRPFSDYIVRAFRET